MCVVRGERERPLFITLCDFFNFSIFMCFLVQHTSSLSLFCRQIKIISFLVSLNRRGKKHNREEGEKEEDKEEEDKEEEEER